LIASGARAVAAERVRANAFQLYVFRPVGGNTLKVGEFTIDVRPQIQSRTHVLLILASVGELLLGGRSHSGKRVSTCAAYL
jgi:hypothetical protein